MSVPIFNDRLDVTIVSDVPTCQLIADTDPDQVAKKWPMQWPDNKAICKTIWREPHVLNVLVGLARKEILTRAELLLIMPISKTECIQLVNREYNAPSGKHFDAPKKRYLTEKEQFEFRWDEIQTWTDRERRVILALTSWVEFANHFIEEMRINSLYGAGVAIERIENSIVYWRLDKASLSYFVMKSKLFDGMTRKEQIQWCSHFVRLQYKGQWRIATLDPGNISAARNRSTGRQTLAVKQSIDKIESAILWYCLLPKPKVST